MKVTLDYPPSANRFWRVNRSTGKPYRSKEANAYKDSTRRACVEAGLVYPLTEGVSVRLVYLHPPGQRIDLDNGIKQVLDALQGFAYVDDKQIVHIEAELVMLPKKNTPYLIVYIEPREAKTFYIPE